MDKATKIYAKALDCYENGYIDKAIALCEESISLNIKNRAIIGLKGILHYLKGEITIAKALWKLNAQMNKDVAAKKYLEQIDLDEQKLKLYQKAVGFIKELKIQEASKLLEQCKESDFNVINVNNALSICYMRQGKFLEAKEKIDKVLSLDVKNKIALKNKKQLISYGVAQYKFKARPILISFFAMILILVSIVSSKVIIKKIEEAKLSNSSKATSSVSKNNIISNTSNSKTVNKSIVNTKSNANSTKVQNNKNAFNADSFKNAVNNKDYNSVYNYIAASSSEKLQSSDNALIAQGKELLSTEGVVFFYKSGCSCFKSNNFEGAEAEFMKAYEYGINSYLYADITYFLATSYKNLTDTNNAIKYYCAYDNMFGNGGSYESTVLYNLATIYKNIDMSKAKEYGNKLSEEYPTSIYNNSNIKDLLSSK